MYMTRSKIACSGMQQDRDRHLLTKLPGSLNELHASLSFFEISRLDSSFLKKPVNTWSSDLSYKEGQRFARNLAHVNDVAERGIQLIQQFNRSSKAMHTTSGRAASETLQYYSYYV